MPISGPDTVNLKAFGCDAVNLVNVNRPVKQEYLTIKVVQATFFYSKNWKQNVISRVT